MKDYLRFFRTRTATVLTPEEDSNLGTHNEVVEFGRMPSFTKLIAWLDAEAFRPLKIGSQLDMVQAAVRANTLREIREHLVKEVARARATLVANGEK